MNQKTCWILNITNNISQRLKNIGPCSVIAAAFIGPGTVTMFSLAGAKFGYSLIWALLISVLLTLFIQLKSVSQVWNLVEDW